MKNLFILPSKKPSRLLKSQNNNFMIIKSDTPNWFEIILKNTYQNIYITNNDGLNENDYVITDDVDNYGKLFQVSWLKNNKIKNCYKVILTTDHDLIKNGVQAIDDEFLEWFVKNPSCQEVEVRKIEDEIISPKNPKIRFNALQDPPSFISAESLNNMILTYKYKIIIPKEEPYQPKTFKELFANTDIIAETDEFGNLNYKFKANMKEELLPKINLIDDWLEKNGDPEIAKQVEKEAKELCKKETLEEAALKYSKKTNASVFQENHKKDFLAGAKFQNELILDFLHSEITERRDYSASKMCEKIIEFIEQFKNK